LFADMTEMKPADAQDGDGESSGGGAWPPAGFADRHGAAAMFGISWETWKQWTIDGKVTCAGHWATAPGGGRRRVYAVADLERLREQMRAAGTIYVGSPLGAGGGLPDGYVSRDEAAQRLGIVPDTLALWHTTGRLRGTWAKSPDGRRCKVYATADVERVIAQLAERPTIPDGFVDLEGALAMFGVTPAAWIIWKRQGKVPRGEWARSPNGAPCRIYAVNELREVFERLRGADKVFRVGGEGRTGRYHIPDGWVQLREASEMFGVDVNTFVRWEREGLITCGRNETGRRIKIYPRVELERLLAENGRYAPPYPDPDRPGVYRVPLAGHDMQRREAIVDADCLPLIERRRFHYSCPRDGEEHGRVSSFNPGGDSRLHSVIMGVGDPGLCVMHRNGDPLDCRRANLVVRTLSERGAAMRKARTFCGRPPTSRFKGVCWDKRKERWKAYVKKGQKMRNIGTFRDEIAAAQAYDEAARELFGEHARLNFPDGVDARLEREAVEAGVAMADGETEALAPATARAA
jgi:predicted site-specific integrase-resolvase